MQRKFKKFFNSLNSEKQSEIEHPKSQINIMGVTSGLRYPLQILALPTRKPGAGCGLTAVLNAISLRQINLEQNNCIKVLKAFIVVLWFNDGTYVEVRSFFNTSFPFLYLNLQIGKFSPLLLL